MKKNKKKQTGKKWLAGLCAAAVMIGCMGGKSAWVADNGQGEEVLTGTESTAALTAGSTPAAGENSQTPATNENAQTAQTPAAGENGQAAQAPSENENAQTAQTPAETTAAENAQAGAPTAPAESTAAENTQTGEAGTPAEAPPAPEQTADFGLTAVSALLMEASTGTIVYEKNADQALSPASITKIMTLILIFDALESGNIHLEDEVTVSAYAKSMGGSQVYLEEGEKQTVETMIKCIVVASGNDASVAMAEHLAGSETEFVRQMNERARELGMTQTKFEDCCGLTDSTTHVTSARDVAIMSRELITRYPQIHDYSSIWMENITHNTAQGSSEFGLANTNKLLKQYEGCNGLKTGSTSLAKYCVSATATRDGVTLIAVIMAAQDYKIRFSEAATLLNYGFASCRLYTDENPESLPLLPLENGVQENFALRYGDPFSYLSVSGEDFSAITKEWIYNEPIQAPVTEGDVVGSLVYSLNGREIGRVEIQAAESVEEAGYLDYWKKVWEEFRL